MKVSLIGIVLLAIATQPLAAQPQINVSQQSREVAKSLQGSATNHGKVENSERTTPKAKRARRNELAESNKNAKIFYNLGVKYGRSRLYRESAQAFRQAINLRPDYIDAYLGLGHAYSDLGLWKEAISTYEKAIELDPKDEEAYTRLGQAYAKLRAEARTNDPRASNVANNNTAAGATLGVASTTALTSAPTNEEAKADAPMSAAPPPIEKSVLEKSVAPETNDAAPKPAATSAAPDAASPKEATLRKEDAPANPAVAANPMPSTAIINSKDPTSAYLVGSGDVLDIHRLSAEPTQSTLFTVTAAGMLEYPLLGEPLQVAGLDTNEIAARLESELKRRGIEENPKVTVGVREYASHHIIVSGLVNEPGTKVLRREAIPLYVVIADAQPHPEAGQALIISREGGQPVTVDLTDSQAKGKLIFPGDVITVEAKSPQFFYIGGSVRAPGQKPFHPGITLTQAILGAGRKLSDVGDVNIIRQSENGLLATTTYDLKSIVAGKSPDPSLQPDDRIEVAP